MVSPQTHLFHNYSSLSCCSSGRGLGGVGSDHCLQSDFRANYPSSPNSLTLYEQDHLEKARSLTSIASDSPGDIAQLEDLDCNNESLQLDLDSLCPSFEENYVRGDTVWSPTEPSLLKMEDVFQVDKNDVVQGPTLAQLNGEDSISLLDDIVTLLGNDLDPQKGFMWGTQNFHTFVQSSPLMQQQPQQPRSCTISNPSMLSARATQSPPMPAQEAAAADTGRERMSPNLTGVAQPTQRQQQPQIIKQEPYQISAKFSVYSSVPRTSPTSSNCTQPTLPNLAPATPNRSPIQKKQSLQEYLEAPPYTPNTSANKNSGRSNIKPNPTATPMPVIKQEPMDFENLSTQSMDRKWEEIKQFIDEAEKARPSQAANSPLTISPKSEPKDVAFSPSEDMESSTLKIDEDDTEIDTNADSDSDDDTMDGDFDHAEFLLSEAESDSEEAGAQGGKTGAKKTKRYFWQYNTQAKGPKGKRLCKSVTNCDPHVLGSFEDPVFDPDLNQMSYKHNGKARKGDGNDITPSPLKLYQIGQELKKLTRTINDLRPVNELPVNVRSRSRKEKNKLASRACRLKKKAQHEANKLKLYGLDNEHKSLMKVINALKKNFVCTIQEGEIKNSDGPCYVELYNTHVQQYLAGKVAGNTAKYVNTVLAKVSGGDSTGGIN